MDATKGGDQPLDATAAADNILATATYYRSMLGTIRHLRLTGKAAVDAAAPEDITTTAQTYLDQLEAIQPNQ